MAKAPKPPKGKDKLDLGRKVGPLPLWGWIVVAIAAWYAYKRFYVGGAGATAPGSEGYDTYVPAAGADFGGGGAGGGDNGYVSPPGDVPPAEEIVPPEEEGGGVDGDSGGGPGKHNRRHKIERIKRKTGKRITALKRGGVTTRERARIKQIKERRKTRIKKIRAGRR